MTRRRMHFATPFVLVLGCKRPIEAPTPGEHDQTDDDRAPTYVASNIDAPMAWPTRIDPPDPPDAAVRAAFTHCGAQDDGSFVTCNPPRPWRDAGVIGNPPRPPQPIVARIVAREIQSGATVVTLGIGSKRGITPKWKGVFIDENDKPVPGGEIQIFRVTESVTVAKVKLTIDQVTRYVRVRLTFPDD